MKDGLKIFTDPRVTAYEAPGHPESPKRVSAAASYLEKQGFTLSPPVYTASSSDVLTTHSPHHWSDVQTGHIEDPDTPAFDNISEIALISLSGAISAFDAALAGTPSFSLMRPPGHHAGENRVAGFCYLNNMAIVCQRALKQGKRIAVLDVDVHHGDGTQSIALGRENWLFVSLHQSPLYPGTGLFSDKNCLNHPLPPGTGPEAYLEELDKAISEIQAFKPDLIGVSAGFDTFKECPLAQLKLEIPTYREISSRVAALKTPRFALLEGGYAEALPQCVEQFLLGWR